MSNNYSNEQFLGQQVAGPGQAPGGFGGPPLNPNLSSEVIGAGKGSQHASGRFIDETPKSQRSMNQELIQSTDFTQQNILQQNQNTSGSMLPPLHLVQLNNAPAGSQLPNTGVNQLGYAGLQDRNAPSKYYDNSKLIRSLQNAIEFNNQVNDRQGGVAAGTISSAIPLGVTDQTMQRTMALPKRNSSSEQQFRYNYNSSGALNSQGLNNNIRSQ